MLTGPNPPFCPATTRVPPCRSLRLLLQYEGPGSVEDVFCQRLTVEVPGFGDTRVVPLREGGADIPVTGGRGGGAEGGRWAVVTLWAGTGTTHLGAGSSVPCLLHCASAWALPTAPATITGAFPPTCQPSSTAICLLSCLPAFLPSCLPACLPAEENRREFVELYVSFWLNRSIHSQFEAFAKGFLMLCGGPALQVGAVGPWGEGRWRMALGGLCAPTCPGIAARLPACLPVFLFPRR